MKIYLYADLKALLLFFSGKAERLIAYKTAMANYVQFEFDFLNKQEVEIRDDGGNFVTLRQKIED